MENTTYIPTDPTDVGANGDPTAVFLDDDWLTPEEIDHKVRSGHRQDTIRDTFEPVSAPTLPSAPTRGPSSVTADDVPDLIVEPSNQREQRANQREQQSHQREQRANQRDLRATADNQREQVIAPPAAAAPPPAPLPLSAASTVPPVWTSPIGVRRSTRSTKGVFQNPRYIDEVYLNALHTVSDIETHQAQLAYLADLLTCQDSGFVDIGDPRVYATKVRGKDADSPTYQQAMNGPDAAQYLVEAMKLEIHTLISQRT